MFSIEFSNYSMKFLKNADTVLAARLIQRIERLAQDPFPRDVKRIVNRQEKVFRIRVGDYRIQYSVFYDHQIIFISDIDKRQRAYD